MPEDDLQTQTMNQKKMLFANSGHLDTVILLLREASSHEKLVGDTEYETVVNAVTLDAQSDLIMNFINMIDSIKSGGLISSE